MTIDTGSGRPPDREVQVARSFAAPRELVLEAFLDPVQVASWWAPTGFEIPALTVDIEPRVGGRIHFSMVAVESDTEFPVRFEILELSKPNLLVLRSEAMPDVGIPQPTITRIAFEDEGTGTKVTITQGPHTDTMLPRALAGWKSCLDKLESVVATQT